MAVAEIITVLGSIISNGFLIAASTAVVRYRLTAFLEDFPCARLNHCMRAVQAFDGMRFFACVGTDAAVLVLTIRTILASAGANIYNIRLGVAADAVITGGVFAFLLENAVGHDGLCCALSILISADTLMFRTRIGVRVFVGMLRFRIWL